MREREGEREGEGERDRPRVREGERERKTGAYTCTGFSRGEWVPARITMSLRVIQELNLVLFPKLQERTLLLLAAAASTRKQQFGPKARLFTVLSYT